MIVAVLDFSTGEICIYRYSTKNFENNIELYIESKGHKISDCQYMCTNELNLKISNG